MTEEEVYPNRVVESFQDKVIFVTGGTGFVGKVLIEKLLRSCEPKRIYVLTRTKKGKDPNERIKDIFNGPLFDMVKEERGADVMKKVEAIAGDVTLPGFGLTPEDKQTLMDGVQIVFHCAATIRFDEALKKAILINVRGTKIMIELAKQMKKLQVYVHLSTAYCHLRERILYEKAYPPPASPHHVIKTAEWMSDEIMDSITDKILGDYPNTYSFTKALSESLVVDEFDNLPVVLLRPSIILPIWKEPIPGWTDNINGPTGLLIGAGKGVIRTMYCKGESYGDYLPVDISVNCMILTTYDYITTKKRRIFNLTSSSEYKLSWEEIIELGRDIINTRMPLNGVMWYPGGSMKKSKIVHLICFYLFHMLPAIVLDGLLILLGYKPVLMRVQKRVSKGFEVFEYYANNQWDFNNDEAMEARKQLNPTERKMFKVDGVGLNYKDYFTDCVHSARLYILNESDESIPAAKRHMLVMYVADKVCKGLMAVGFLYLLFTYMLKLSTIFWEIN